MGSRAFKACYSVVTAASGNTLPPLGGSVTGPSRRGFSVIIGLTIGSHAQQASIRIISAPSEARQPIAYHSAFVISKLPLSKYSRASPTCRASRRVQSSVEVSTLLGRPPHIPRAGQRICVRVATRSCALFLASVNLSWSKLMPVNGAGYLSPSGLLPGEIVPAPYETDR